MPPLVKAPPGSNGDDEEEDIIEFNPVFTYPIFGEQEQIFGYKDLIINVGNKGEATPDNRCLMLQRAIAPLYAAPLTVTIRSHVCTPS